MVSENPPGTPPGTILHDNFSFPHHKKSSKLSSHCLFITLCQRESTCIYGLFFVFHTLTIYIHFSPYPRKMEDQFNGRTDDDLFADDFEPFSPPPADREHPTLSQDASSDVTSG